MFSRARNVASLDPESILLASTPTQPPFIQVLPACSNFITPRAARLCPRQPSSECPLWRAAGGNCAASLRQPRTRSMWMNKPSNWVLEGPFAPRNPAGRLVLSVLWGSPSGRRRGRARYLWFELDGTIFTASG